MIGVKKPPYQFRQVDLDTVVTRMVFVINKIKSYLTGHFDKTDNETFD
jgi:hypothetical protein